MRFVCVIFVCFLCLDLAAQDKVFFSNGQVQQGIVVSIARDAVFFKKTDTSAVQKINKSELLMVENYRGVRYIFGAKATADPAVKKATNTPRNALGVQPLGILTGRGTLVYERLSKNDKIGLVLPLSLTFDPLGILYNSSLDTNRNGPRRIKGINFIIGLDVNFYIGQNERARFFIGPRARYGSDLFLRDTEGYSLQTQLGWRFAAKNEKFMQHLSLGFGFAHILSSPFGRRINPKQSYGWYSVNYKLSLRW